MPFQFNPLKIKDLLLIKPSVFGDKRGFFIESYKKSDFIRNGITEAFVQDNHSFSQKNVLRGLHYQLPPSTQGKLLRVVKGAVWDVAVDIRKASPTFLHWEAVELSDENNHMLYIPPGFAHGFVTLSDEVHLFYKCTAEYDPQRDRGVIWNDPEIAVNWPVENPLVSDKDKSLPLLRDAELL